jgi:hypothetical protein
METNARPLELPPRKKFVRWLPRMDAGRRKPGRSPRARSARGPGVPWLQLGLSEAAFAYDHRAAKAADR